MIKAGIVGATGYTGAELLRLLAGHPDVDIQVITSRSEQGQPVAELYPNLRSHVDLSFVAPDAKQLGECDVVFFATPHGVAQAMMDEILKTGTRVVDLSADFRIKDVTLWESWYGQKHNAPQWVESSVYGLPEVNREAIAGAQLVAAPGCYPTAIQLGFLPLLENKLVDGQRLIANAASGVSGAGRQAKVDNLFAEMGESFKAYGVSGHRHLPEIEQGLQQIAGDAVQLTFVPHLLPVIRGIHATLYATLTDTDTDLQKLFEQRYKDEPFVDVLPEGTAPQTRTIKGTNLCQLAVVKPQNSQKQNSDQVVVLSSIDNLTKGAAGQAVQCMNIMLGLNETAGLMQIGLLP